MPNNPELLSGDIEARKDALDITRSFIVQAPAGSGKTELLIQRYLALLSTVDHPEEVLAITFTRKAAFEMQHRVIKALRRAHQGFVAETDHERQTLKLALQVIKQDESKGWYLIQSPGRMRIATVDAFCAGIARLLPMTSGLGGIGVTITEADADTLYKNAAAATLDHLSRDGAGGEAIECILRHLDNDTSLYIRYLAQMLASREQWLGITGSGIGDDKTAATARIELEKNIESAISRQLSYVDELLPEDFRTELPEVLRLAGGNLLGDGRADHPLAKLATAAQLPSAIPTERVEWGAIGALMVTKNGLWRRRHDKRNGLPPECKDEKAVLMTLIESNHGNDDLRKGFYNLRDLPSPKYSDEQWNVLLALLKVLPLAVAELRRLFAEQGVTDHNEVALSAGRALGNIDEPGDIALMLDYKVQHLLIDEMQDTSIGQYDVLRKLTAGWNPSDGRTIFCVGDPMQSIYRFRDAEVGEFLLARRNGIGNVALEPLTLRRNFRSGENLVYWFNKTFGSIMPNKEDVNVGAIAHASSIPVEETAGLGEYRLHTLFDASPEEEAERSLQVIRDCLENSKDENITVLVRSRTHLTFLMPLLRQAGIEYEAIEIDRLTDRPEIIDLIALTRALCHEGDRLAWLSLLRGPWCGLRWVDLHALVSNDYRQTVLELCKTPERFSSLSDEGQHLLSSLLETLEPYLLGKTNLSLREKVERAWCQLGGPAWIQDESQLENAYMYLEMLDKLDFAGTLHDVVELKNRLENQRVSTTVGAECRVQFMTMHKAKGLQFDHVILHALGRRPRGDRKELLTWLNLPEGGIENKVVISPIGRKGSSDDDPLYRFIHRTDQEKTKMELDRLLYVACTRAKKSLHLVGSVKVSKGGEISEPEKTSLLKRLWPAVAGQYQEAFKNLQSTEEIGDRQTEYMVIDVETANADMSSICQIGVVHCIDFEVVEEWKSYVNPQDYFSRTNVAIHGIKEEAVSGEPTFPEIFGSLKQRLEGKIVVCHSHFDRVALDRAAEKYGLGKLNVTWLDTAKVVRRTWKDRAYTGYGLKDVCDMLGYKFTHHDALEDAKAAAHILKTAIQLSGKSLEQWLYVTNSLSITSAKNERSDKLIETRTKSEGIFCRPILHRLSSSWQKPLPPEPDFLSGCDQAPNIENDRLVEYYWVGGAARNAGTIVHRWLQRLAEETTDLASVNFEEVRRVSRRWAETMGGADSQVSDVCQRTDEAIRNILEDPKGRWILEGEGACELPVSGILDGRVESIIIDRVRIDDDGAHWIVDYKTSSHEGGNLEGFLKQEAERYRPQLQKYATIYENLTSEKVRTALYFPLLKEFYEVKI